MGCLGPSVEYNKATCRVDGGNRTLKLRLHMQPLRNIYWSVATNDDIDPIPLTLMFVGCSFFVVRLPQLIDKGIDSGRPSIRAVPIQSREYARMPATDATCR